MWGVIIDDQWVEHLDLYELVDRVLSKRGDTILPLYFNRTHLGITLDWAIN